MGTRSYAAIPAKLCGSPCRESRWGFEPVSIQLVTAGGARSSRLTPCCLPIREPRPVPNDFSSGSGTEPTNTQVDRYGQVASRAPSGRSAGLKRGLKTPDVRGSRVRGSRGTPRSRTVAGSRNLCAGAAGPCRREGGLEVLAAGINAGAAHAACRPGHNPARPSVGFRPDSAKLQIDFSTGSERTDSDPPDLLSGRVRRPHTPKKLQVQSGFATPSQTPDC